MNIFAAHINSSYHDGDHGGIDLHYIRSPYGIAPAAFHKVHLLQSINHRGVHGRSVLKLQYHQREVGIGERLDGLQIFQSRQALLQRLRYLLLDLLRSSPRIGGHDHHVRQINGRQKIRRHPCEGNDAQCDDDYDADDDRQRLFNAVL